MLALDFQFASFSHVSRICNVVADALAKKAKTCKGTQVRLEELPEDIASLVGFDVHWSLFSFIMNKLPGTASLVSKKKKKIDISINENGSKFVFFLIYLFKNMVF